LLFCEGFYRLAPSILRQRNFLLWFFGLIASGRNGLDGQVQRQQAAQDFILPPISGV
jgi:hypothetical protein